MRKKIVVIGTNHAGTNCLVYLADNFSEEVELVTYDRNTNISFLGCGMALWISGMINDPKGLFYASPELLEEKGIKVNMETELLNIDFNNKVIELKRLENGEIFKDNYDKLIIATGSWPILPPIKGIELNNVVFAKLYQNAENIIKKLQNKNIKKVAIVGAGYIGIELAEAFYKHGKEVVLINDKDILNFYYDTDFQNLMRKNIEDKVKLCLGEKLVEISGDDNGNVNSVTTDKGSKFDVDMVLLSVGHRPNTDLFKNTELELNERGMIKVNDKQETNIKDVYAIGDCADIKNNALDKRMSIMLATNAVRTGIIAAMNSVGKDVEFNGTQGSNAIHIFGLSMCSTGLTECLAKENGIDFDSVTHEDMILPDFMPNNEKVLLKIIWNKKDLRIIGAQIASKQNITLALHMFSLAIEQGYTIDKLAFLDLFFLPHFNKPINFITKTALLALDKINKYKS